MAQTIGTPHAAEAINQNDPSDPVPPHRPQFPSGFTPGSEFLVNSYTGHEQRNPQLATLESGGFVAVYSSQYFYAVGQRFSANGQKMGPEFTIGSSREDPAVHALPGGGFAVAYVRNSNSLYEVVVQRYTESGAALGAPVLVSSSADVSRMQPALSVLTSGQIAVAWTETNAFGNFDVKLRRFDGALTPMSAEELVPSIQQGSQQRPIIAPLDDGGFVINWYDSGTIVNGSFMGDTIARLYDASGQQVGAEFSLDRETYGDQYGSVASLADGGFVATYSRGLRNSSGVYEYAIEAQRYAASGEPLGSETTVSVAAAGAKQNPIALALSGGFFLIVWTDGSAAGWDGSGYAIKAQLFDAAGARVGPELQVNEVTPGYQYRAAATLLPTGGFVISWTDTSGIGGDPNTAVKARIFQPSAIAKDDAVATDESAVLHGNLFGDNGSGADTGAAALAGVNGLSAAIGKQITLASGALLTVRWDGTFSYDPNHKFDSLSGSQTATDTFTYTLTSGITATVTVTVGGVASASGDRLVGSAIADILTGEAGAELFLLHQGGDDTASGGGGNDRFFFGAAFTNLDRVTGGDGEDSLILAGNYDFAFAAASFQGVERLRLLSAETGAYDYRLTLHDGNVAAGAALLVDARDLKPGETLIFDGSAEKDGLLRIFGGAGADILAGGAGADALTGGDGNDALYGLTGDDSLTGGAGADRLHGGIGVDRFLYLATTESTGSGFDSLLAFDARFDRIDLPGAVLAWHGTVTGGALSAARFDSDLGSLVDPVLGEFGAVLLKAATGDFAGRTFLVVDADGDGAYLPGSDYLFEMINPILPQLWGTDMFV